MTGRKGISIAAASAAALLAAGLLASPEPGADIADKGTTGFPDVTVFRINGISHYGEVGGVHSYAVGTTSCNIGTEPLWWCDDNRSYCNDEQHPVIAQNLYRLKDGRFEQLGMSWLKHGFLSLNTPHPDCGTCASPPHGGDQLGVGCTDAYSSGLNGSRYLGMRSEVQPTAGSLDPYPFTPVPFSGALDQRLLVEETDLDPVLNADALYWVEGHYIAADDASYGKAANNASYHEVKVSSGTYNLSMIGNTVREKAALFAWQAVDPEVQIYNVSIPSLPAGGLFHAARKVTVAGGVAHFEYAIHNMSSDRAANRFTVEFPAGTAITNVGCRDGDHHSGEPYATADWTIEVNDGTVSWFADDFATDANANALRWGTAFSFWFDAAVNDLEDDLVHTLGLFKPGLPTQLTIPFVATSNAIFLDGFESGDTSKWQ